MSENRIGLDPAMLRAKAGNIRAYKEKQDQIVKTVRKTVNGLSDAWQGKSQKEFTDSFNGMKKTFDEFSAMLEKYAVAIEKYAAKMETADKS